MSRFVRACAVEMHMNISLRAILCGNLHEKCRTLIPRHPFVRACIIENAHGLFTRAILHGNLQEKWPRTPPGTSFCASLRSRNAHEHVWKFTGDWPDTDDTTSIEHRALTVTVRTPQCGHIVWGKNNDFTAKEWIYIYLFIYVYIYIYM